MLFFPGWSTMLAGYFINDKHLYYFTPEEWLNQNHLLILLAMLSFASAMGACFLLNQIEDVEGDKKNKKLFLISENHLPVKSIISETYILIFFSLILSLTINIAFFSWLIVFIVITGYLYNYKPFIFKDRALGSLLANGAMGFIAFAIGWSINNNLSFKIVIDSLPYVFFNTALYFYTTLPDIKGDESSGKNLLSVQYGKNKIINISSFLYLSGLILTFFLMDKFAIIIAIFSFPFFIMAFIDKKISSAVQTVKFTILFFALAVCMKWPFYLILMLSIYFFTRWYYANRFQFNYPNFKGN